MDCLVSAVNCCNQELRVEKEVTPLSDILCCNGVHVVNQHPAMNFPPLDAEVASVIPNNDLVTGLFPFRRTVEQLVQITVKSKSFLAHRS